MQRNGLIDVHDDASCRCSESLCELPGINSHLIALCRIFTEHAFLN